MAEEFLEAPILSVYWSDLAPHHRRDALWVFSFDLKEIALAIAEDHTRIIQAWVDSGSLRKPEAAEVEMWSNQETWSQQETAESTRPRFYYHAVIIQPFVIMSPKPLTFIPSETEPKP